MIYIGLDIGDSRVGVASAEESSPIATPTATFKRAGGAAEREILALLAEGNVKLVVAGLPLNASGARTDQCDSVERFCRRIEQRAQIKVFYVDEFASTAEAEERFRAAREGSSRRKVQADRKRGVIDALAAAMILQSYLDREVVKK